MFTHRCFLFFVFFLASHSSVTSKILPKISVTTSMILDVADSIRKTKDLSSFRLNQQEEQIHSPPSSSSSLNLQLRSRASVQLAQLMIQYNKKHHLFNLKGIAIGNPVLEFSTDFNSRAEYFWSHGLISDPTYKAFTSCCNYSRYLSEYCRGEVSSMCSKVMSQVSTETSRFVHKYDVTLDVCIPYVLSQSKVVHPQQVGETIFNRRDVQKALHARLVGTLKWAVCSNVLDYELLDVEAPTSYMNN